MDQHWQQTYRCYLIIIFIFFCTSNCLNNSRDDIPLCPDYLRFLSNRNLESHYDFIIIGAGAAGSIVSSELARRLNMSVLLVEAGVETGHDDNINITDPALWLNVVHNDSLEWHFRTSSQSALNNRTIDLGFAKGTGGSAMHNAMGYVRGGQRWMDQWETSEGCPNWNAATLTPYFDRVEEILDVIYPDNDTQGLVDTIFEASHTAGYPYNPSYNRGSDMFGIANFVMSINDANNVKERSSQKKKIKSNYHRVTSYEKYLRTASLPNLQLITDLQAIGFNFDHSLIPTIENVELYDSHFRCKFIVQVDKEVILSAGTINSPKLLQLSGIGNATHLKSLGIQSVKDLPGVGMNLRDDIVVNMVFTTNTIQLESPPASFLSAVLFAVDVDNTSSPSIQWKNGTGALTNIEMLFSTGNMIGNSWPVEWQNSLVLSPNIQQCKSRGTVQIASVDPLAFPSIDPAYLSIDSDFDRVINAIELGRKLLAQPSFAKWNFEEVSPGSNYTSRSSLIEWIRQNATTGFHYIGTCKMGTDALSVIDPHNMKVWGVERLRIVDASVAPASFSANTQSMTYAVAARAVDLIIQDYFNRKKPIE